MKRRTLLKGVVGSTAIGFAGCLTQRDSTGTNGGDDTSPNTTGRNDKQSEEDINSTEGNDDTSGADEGNDNPDPTSTSKPSLVHNSFEIVSAGCGTGKSDTSVSFGDSVRVTGTIRGKNSCYTAELKSAVLDQGTLTVTVRSFETENSGVCAMCLKTIEYESTYTFEGGLPERVVVIHNGTPQARVDK
jgi:hypothetical protein